MPDLKVSLGKKSQDNLAYALTWFARSQKDFRAFKLLVRVDPKTRAVVRCSDPALAVYLLQQSIEKATKAVAAATGKYSYRKLKKHGHNSLNMLLDFYSHILEAISGIDGIQTFINLGFGLDITEGLKKFQDVASEAGKTEKDRINGEALESEKYAISSAIEIDKILDFLLTLRGIFIEGPNLIFGPHSKVIIPRQEILSDSPEQFVNSLLDTAKSKLNIPQFSGNQMKALSTWVEIFGSVKVDEDVTKAKVVLEEGTKEQIAQWSLISLVFLAAITFPHESTARYPGPKNRKGTRLTSCDQYVETLGVVNRLGRLGYVTLLTLEGLKPELTSIAGLFPLMDSGLIKKNNPTPPPKKRSARFHP